MLHTDDALVSLFGEVLENIAVVDLAGAGFFATGIVACLQVGDFVPRGVEAGNQIIRGDLLVIQIEEDLAGRTVDRPAERMGLFAAAQKHAAVVSLPVEWLQHHDEFVRLEHRAKPAQQLGGGGDRLQCSTRSDWDGFSFQVSSE